MYSNTSQTRGPKLAEFSNSRFLSLFFTSKLAVPLLSTQIRDFCYFLSPKIREFGGITVLSKFNTLGKMENLHLARLRISSFTRDQKTLKKGFKNFNLAGNFQKRIRTCSMFIR